MKNKLSTWLKGAGTGTLSAAIAVLVGGLSASYAQGTDLAPTAKAEKTAKQDKGKMPAMGKMVEGGTGKMGGMSGMTAVVPRLKEVRVTTVKGDENWDVRTGFGRNEEMVGMMILMMAEGSGMEHMKMGAMNMDFGPKNFTETPDELVAAAPPASQKAPVAGDPAPPAAVAESPAPGESANARAAVTVTLKANPPAVGDNVLDILVTDPATGKPVTGLKLTSLVEMTSMDMGQEKPPVKETGDGHYAVTVKFSMKGPWRVALGGNLPEGKPLPLEFRVDGKTPWRQKGAAVPPKPAAATPQAAPPATQEAGKAKPPVARAQAPVPTSTARTASGLRVTATVGGKAAVGDNNVTITLLDAQGKPVTGAKIAASVAMTSMDMGTTAPAVREEGNGKYTTTANFSMSGPWRVALKVGVGGKKPEAANLDFAVSKK